MSTETGTRTDIEESTNEWVGGVLAGIVGSIVMGALMVVQMRPVLEMAIPALYGIAGPAGAVGFTIYVVHGAIFGLVFAALLSLGQLRGYADAVGRSVGLGIGYGVVIWVVAAAILMPVWLSAVGFPGAPPVGNFNTTSLVGHAVFGAVLGAVYPFVKDL
jgi:fucose 4-O-acetylase-like acetyltransferase